MPARCRAGSPRPGPPKQTLRATWRHRLHDNLHALQSSCTLQLRLQLVGIIREALQFREEQTAALARNPVLAARLDDVPQPEDKWKVSHSFRVRARSTWVQDLPLLIWFPFPPIVGCDLALPRVVS